MGLTLFNKHVLESKAVLEEIVKAKRDQKGIGSGRSDQQGVRHGTTKQIIPEVIQISADLMEQIKALRKKTGSELEGRGL
jgi:hypothetical protein